MPVTHPKTWDQFRMQRLKVEFSEYVQTSYILWSPPRLDTLEQILRLLARSIAEAAYKCGYKPMRNPEIFIKPPSGPLDNGVTVGAKVLCQLVASPEQYVSYISCEVERLAAEVNDLTTVRGFLRMKWRRLVLAWRSFSYFRTHGRLEEDDEY